MTLKEFMYEPKPIDTAQIELPKSISLLTERLAESCHDNWAIAKLAQGITDHKDLIPYGELDEPTKDYDRKTAMETLKAIYALGYEIVPARKLPVIRKSPAESHSPV